MPPPSQSSSSDKPSLAEERTYIQSKLSQKPGPEYLKIDTIVDSKTPKQAGILQVAEVDMEEWQMVNLANEVFGFDGWSSKIVGITVDHLEENTSGGRVRSCSVAVTAIVKVTLKSYDGNEGIYREGAGNFALDYVTLPKGLALIECKDKAVVEARKSALRSFGNLLGNCLHDIAYHKGIRDMIQGIPHTYFAESELHRRKGLNDQNVWTVSDGADLVTGTSTTNSL